SHPARAQGGQETGPARRLDPYAEKARACAPSGAVAQVLLSLLRISRGTLVRIHRPLKIFQATGIGVTGAFGKLMILLTCWKLGNKSAWATWLLKLNITLKERSIVSAWPLRRAIVKYALTLQNLRSNGATWARQHQYLANPLPRSNCPLPVRNHSDGRRCSGKSSLS